MKKIFLTLTAGIITTFGYASEKEIESEIKSVTVYPSNAQIERMASYNITKGEHKLIIDGVSPYLDPNTLQVKVSGKALVLDAQFKTVYPEPLKNKPELPVKIKKSIALLNDSIEDLKTKIARENMELEIWTMQKKMLVNNGTMRGEGKVNDSIPLLKNAMEYYSKKMTEIKKAEFEITQKLEVLNKIRKGMNSRLKEYRNYHKKTRPAEQNKNRYHIILTMLSEVPTYGKVNVQYMVSSAGWTPTYDLIQTNGSDKMNLSFKAQVTQNTGVDWEDVNLTLGTNNPSHNKTKPSLHPWFIRHRRTVTDYERNKTRQNTPTSTVDNNLAKTEEVAYNNNSVAHHTTRVEQLIHANYEINLKYDIASNGETHHVLIAKDELKTQYKHYVVPKMDLSTYLVAEVTGWGDLQLQSGQANIYFDGSFVGKTQINPNVMNDTLQLSLGQDPSLVVKRTLVSKDSKEKVIGNKKVQTVAYSITYKNNKSKSVELVIQDQIPISQSNEYEIELNQEDSGKLDEQTGILTWYKNVRAQDSGEIEFEYQVKTDKENYLTLR